MALWAGRGISKFVFGANGIQRLPFLGGDRLAAIFNTMGAVSKTAFTAWLDSPPGRKAFAEWVLGDTLAAAGFKYVTDFISGMVKTGYDKIITALGSDKAPQPAKPMAPPLERPGQTVYSGATGAALN